MARFRTPWALALGYTLLVILFGAVVRITGSGAGCGQHWPTCHGEIAHLPGTVETMIEFTHRTTSGLSLLLVVGLALWTRRVRPPGHLARRAAWASCVFMVVEALVGAALVLLALVGKNDSWARAAVMAVHLVNTAFLTLAMLTTAWSLGQGSAPRLSFRLPAAREGLAGGAGILLVSALGAVTALGDTVYPLAAEAKGFSVGQMAVDGAESGVHFLERLRGVHPVVAVGVALYLLSYSVRLHAGFARAWIAPLVCLQLLAGILNVWLSAPGWMQVLHLALANFLWLAWCGALLDTALLPAALGAVGADVDAVARAGTVSAS